MPAARKRRVAILGGGMAGLTAAWSLSEPEARDDVEICVFERAASLGGKGASTRGIHGRIEEHGLHVWLGYYENAFRLIRAVYDELDRPVTDPACPIASWRDAFAPADLVGVGDRRDGSWSHWVAAFGRNDGEPGDGGAADGPLSVVTFVRRGLGLLLDFSDSIGARLACSHPTPQAARARSRTTRAVARARWAAAARTSATRSGSSCAGRRSRRWWAPSSRSGCCARACRAAGRSPRSCWATSIGFARSCWSACAGTPMPHARPSSPTW